MWESLEIVLKQCNCSGSLATQAGGGSGDLRSGIRKYNDKNNMQYKLEKIKIKTKLQCRVHRLDESVMYGEKRQGVFHGCSFVPNCREGRIKCTRGANYQDFLK